MSRIAIWAALAGLALGTGAVIWLGAGNILHAILKIGWLGFFYVVIWQLIVFAALGVAWRVLCPGAGVWIMIWGRLVREGGVTCLPFSGVGGLAIGARAIMLGGVGFARAAASSIVDVIAEGIGLAPFLVFGLAVLLARRAGSSLAVPMSLGVGALLLGGVLVFRLRLRLAKLLRDATAWLLKGWVEDAPQRAQELHQEIDGLIRQHGRLAGSSLIHMLCWCGGAGNVWIAYHLLGAKLSILGALAIESCLSGVLSVGFLIPGGLGVQELTYVGIGHLFGMPADLSLALSLIRRARDLILGAPALLVWQALEAWRLKESRR